jgi:predicted aspartyl protease
MGTFFHPITVIGPEGEETVEALVDTGASFTTMPASLLRRLGVTPYRKARLRLANGEVAEWDLGRAQMRINGTEEDSICIFGSEDSPPVIGAHTLQAMLLGVDPVEHRLVPQEGF